MKFSEIDFVASEEGKTYTKRGYTEKTECLDPKKPK